MIRSFIFSKGKLLNQDPGLDVLRVVLYDEDVQIWVDAEKPSEEEIKSVLQDLFNFHPLAIEDCVAVSERPKIDDYENYIFMVIHAVDYLHKQHEFCTTELNLFVGKNFLVTYHDEPLRSINTMIERVQKNAPSIARAPDRLSYHILDTLLDNYQPAISELSEEIGQLEKRVLSNQASAEILHDVIQLKTEVSHLRQIITPQREVIARIARGEFFKVVRAHLLPYFRDLLDNLVRLSTMADSYRDSLTDVMQMHLNLQQMQANRVTKVLTLLATLGMPVLAVTGFYGMNIHHMPNTEWPSWPFAYAWVLGLIAGFTGLLYWFIRRKGWY